MLVNLKSPKIKYQKCPFILLYWTASTHTRLLPYNMFLHFSVMLLTYAAPWNLSKNDFKELYVSSVRCSRSLSSSIVIKYLLVRLLSHSKNSKRKCTVTSECIFRHFELSPIHYPPIIYLFHYPSRVLSRICHLCMIWQPHQYEI